MKHFIGFVLLATGWAYAQDGFYLQNPAEPARAAIEDNQLVFRIPVSSNAVPRAKGILLVDSEWNSKPPYTLHIILDETPAEEPAPVVVLGGVVFSKIRVSRLAPFIQPVAGWLSLPVEGGRRPSECLRNAERVFGADTKWVHDLRLSDEERITPAKVQGQLSAGEVSEIRRVVFTMARRQIIEHLAQSSYEAWPRLLREWPGRHALDIRVEGRQAAVYYAPDAGYQLEKIDGKWSIVGG